MEACERFYDKLDWLLTCIDDIDIDTFPDDYEQDWYKEMMSIRNIVQQAVNGASND